MKICNKRFAYFRKTTKIFYLWNWAWQKKALLKIAATGQESMMNKPPGYKLF